MSESKHTAYDLAQMQAMPLEIKIRMTKERIKEWYEYWDGQVYVGFSGGKDSTVLKHIVDSIYSDVPAVFVNTGLEYPELQRFVTDIKNGKYECFNTNVEIVRPKKRFDEVVKDIGYPVVSKVVAHNIAIARNKPDGRVAKNIVFNKDRTGLFNQYKWRFLVDAPFKVSDKCCEIMKKKPSHDYEKSTGRKPMLGTMAIESKIRYSNWLKHGCNVFDGKTKQTSQPMSFWTDNDVLEYINENSLEIASVYGSIEKDNVGNYYTTGCKRTGCVFCMFGCHLEKEPNKFQVLKKTHPKLYDYCINGGEYDTDGVWKPNKQGLGLGHVLDFINVTY